MRLRLDKFKNRVRASDMNNVTFRAKQLIRLHEGCRLEPYYCTAGKLTWGVGRNLEANPFSKDEVLFLLNGIDGDTNIKTRLGVLADLCLDNDIAKCVDDFESHEDEFPFWNDLDDFRKVALLDMRFMLGPSRFRAFKKMIGAMCDGDFAEAGRQIEDSKWWREGLDKARSRRVRNMIETGVWPL